MKLLFIAFDHEHLAISLLSSIVKKESIETKLLFLLSKNIGNETLLTNELAVFQPDIVAFSVVTSNFQLYLKLAKLIKQINSGIKIIIGGPHCSAVPEIVSQYNVFDYIVIGEGEEALVDICNSIRNKQFDKKIINTWSCNNNNIIKGESSLCFKNLDELPFFDKEIWEDYMDYRNYYITMASRGCPFKCAFCFNSYFKSLSGENKGAYYRKRSVDHLMVELNKYKKKYNFKHIDFFDDIFTININWLKEFIFKYKDINIPFTCYIHPQFIDEDIVRLLSTSKCELAVIGIQSLNEDYKKQYLNRNEKNKEIETALNLLNKYKIHTRAEIILDMPFDKPESNIINLDFFKKNTPSIIESHWYSHLPGTTLTERSFKEGLIDSDFLHKVNNGLNLDSYSRRKVHKKDDVQSYYFLYKILPSIPKKLRSYLSIKFAKRIPLIVQLFLGKLLYFTNVILQKEPRSAHMFRIRYIHFKLLLLYKLKRIRLALSKN